LAAIGILLAISRVWTCDRWLWEKAAAARIALIIRSATSRASVGVPYLIGWIKGRHGLDRQRHAGDRRAAADRALVACFSVATRPGWGNRRHRARGEVKVRIARHRLRLPIRQMVGTAQGAGPAMQNCGLLDAVAEFAGGDAG